MAFMAKLACPWQLPPEVWLEFNTLAPLTRFSQAVFLCCVSGSNLECRTLSVTVKGLCFSVFYILGCIYEVLIVKEDIEVRAAPTSCWSRFLYLWCQQSSFLWHGYRAWGCDFYLAGDARGPTCCLTLCNAITEDAKSMEFIWQTWCDVETARSSFYRLFLSNDLRPSFSKMGFRPLLKREWFKLVYQ